MANTISEKPSSSTSKIDSNKNLNDKGDLGSSENIKTTNPSSSSTTTTTTTTSDNAAGGATEPTNQLTKEEKLKRFENEGVEFKAKLIGSELVMEPRGDKMCQSSIQRLKAMVKGLNTHKKRLTLKISYGGVRVYDEKTNEILHHHQVPQISYIASDDTDSRTFGYVCDLPNKGHQFICFKTSGPAINVMSTISSLFEAVLEKKNKAEEEKRRAKEEAMKSSASIDLVGDSGIMDADLSFSSDINFSKQQATNNQLNQLHHLQSTTSSNMLTDSILSSYDSNFTSSAPVPAWSTSNQQQQQQNITSQFPTNQHQQFPYTTQRQPTQQNIHPQQLDKQNQSLQQQAQPNRLQQQQSSSSGDLLFSDLFFGLSDPIIVDNNDSLVSGKPHLEQASSNHQHHHLTNLSQQQNQTQQYQLHLQQQANSNASANQLQFQQQNQQITNNNPFDPNSSINSNFSNSGAGIMRPRPSSSIQAPQPIPPRSGLNRQSTLNVPGPVMSPLSLPRPGPMMQEPAIRHNRSLVHNHSSVSLSDAALTRQFSFNSPSANQQQTSESYVDRYSVFNDIDNLPSIFESTSVGNVNNYQSSASMSMGGRNLGSNARQTSNMPAPQSRMGGFNF